MRKKGKARAADMARAEITSVKDLGVTSVKPQPQEKEYATESHPPVLCAAGLQPTQGTTDWRRHCKEKVGIIAVGNREKGEKKLEE